MTSILSRYLLEIKENVYWTRVTMKTALWGDLMLSRVAAISFDSLCWWETFPWEMATAYVIYLHFIFFDTNTMHLGTSSSSNVNIVIALYICIMYMFCMYIHIMYNMQVHILYICRVCKEKIYLLMFVSLSRISLIII